ncbi:MAG: cell division protein SepF [Oscillospiraceae bacterium]|jgi:cell division inhibitor SepF|nr:cell division protein SepF [Oscillospiraceae bacterium]
MGFVDELKKLTRPYNEDDMDEYDYDEEEDLEPEPEPAPSPRRSAFSAPDPQPSSTARRSGPARVVNLNNNSSMQVILVKPDRFDTVSEIADHLRDKKAVVLNLESTNKDVARRLVDFLSGVAYALDGKIKKVAISTYILTPFNVEIVGDLVEELENSGVYF